MTQGNTGWTAQSTHGWVHDEGVPGQTFTEDQLPHPEVQRASGINPEQYRNQHGLWVEPAVGVMPQFVGTETGHAPEEVLEKTGHVQSFQSFIPEATTVEETEIPETVTAPKATRRRR